MVLPRLCGSIALMLSWSAASFAATEPNTPPLTLSAALQLTEQHHPALRRIEHERLARGPLRQQSELSPPLSVNLDLENISGTSGFAGTDALESTISLGGLIERGDKAKWRAHSVQRETDALDIRFEQQRRDVLAQTALRFIDVAAAQTRLERAAQAVTVSNETARATQQRNMAGAASSADLARARLALSMAQLELDQAQEGLYGARRGLLVAIGSPNHTYSDVRADLQDLSKLPSEQDVLAWSTEAPVIQLADAGRLLAEARVRLASSQGRADWGWRIGVRADRSSGDQAFVLGFSLPLGSSSRARYAEQSASAQWEASQWERESVALEVQGLVTNAWTTLKQHQQALKRLRDSLIPQAEAVLDAITDGYRAGRYSLLELTSAQRELLAQKSRQLEVATAYHKTRIELECLLGRSLITQDTNP